MRNAGICIGGPLDSVWATKDANSFEHGGENYQWRNLVRFKDNSSPPITAWVPRSWSNSKALGQVMAYYHDKPGVSE